MSSPFILVDLSSYLPVWATDSPDDESSSEEEGFESKVRKKAVKLAGAWGYNQPKAKRLNSMQWVVAFDRYAVAAAATGQMSIALALAYKNMIMEIMMTSKAEKRTAISGVIYDELVRKDWANRAYNSDRSLDLIHGTPTAEDKFKDRARAVFDSYITVGA